MPTIFPPIHTDDQQTLANLFASVPPPVVSGPAPNLGNSALGSVSSTVPTLPATAPALVQGPVDLAQRDVTAAQSKLAADTPQPYDYHQHGVLGNIGHIAGRIGNIAGDILDPGATALIPHSDLWNARRLAGDQEQLSQAQGRQDAIQREQDQVDERSQDRADREAEAARDRWMPVAGFQGPNGEPMEHNETTGQYRVADIPGAKQTPKPGQEPLGADRVKSINQSLADVWNANPDNKGKPVPEQYVLPANATEEDYKRVDQMLSHLETSAATQQQREVAAQERQANRAQMQENHEETMAVIHQRLSDSENAAANKQNTKDQAGQAALQYASDYLSGGNFSGSGDEAMMEKYFELAKPSSGFRMTEAQQNMLKNSRSWMNSLEGKAYHAIYGTWFTDKQRKEIVSTMSNLQRANNEAKGSGGSVPGGTTTRYTVNGQPYDIPADKEAAFLKKYPNAQKGS